MLHLKKLSMQIKDICKIKNIDFVVRFVSQTKCFSSINKPAHIIGIKLSGSADHFFSEKSFNVGEGDCYFLNRNEDYNVKELVLGEAFSVHFTTYEPIETESFRFCSTNLDELFKQLIKIEKQSLSRGNDHRLIADFHILCSMFLKQINAGYSHKDLRMNDAGEFIDENFCLKDCLCVAADMSGISRRIQKNVY